MQIATRNSERPVFRKCFLTSCVSVKNDRGDHLESGMKTCFAFNAASVDSMLTALPMLETVSVMTYTTCS